MVTARNKAIIALGIIVAAVAVIVSGFRLSTDLSIFLPEPDTRFDKLLHHQLDNSASSNIIFLAVSGEGQDSAKIAELNLNLSEALLASGKFSKVTNNASALGDESLSFLVENRYLLSHSDLSARFSPAGLAEALAARLKGLASATAPLEKKFLRQDPTGEVLGLLSEWEGKLSRHKRPEELHGVWFSDDHTRSLILLEIAADISRLQNQVDAVNEIRNQYAQLHEPGFEIIMTGPAVFAVESSENIREDVKILTIIAMVLVLLFLFAVYRSPAMVFMIACPLGVGILVATAFIVLLYGQVHGITLAFGMTLAGVAVDYPIHILTGLGSSQQENLPRIKKIWRTLRLGVFSTIIAYAAFLISGFRGLQQLGLFTIIGLLAAAYFSRWVLPVMASWCRQCEPGLSSMHNVLEGLGRKASTLYWLVAVVFAGALLSLIVSDRPILHLNVDSLSPINEQRRAEGKMLRSDLGFWYGGSMMIINGTDREDVLQSSEDLQTYLDQLVQQDAIDGYDMAAHFLPSMRHQALQKERLADVSGIRAVLEQELSEFPFRKDVFDPFMEDLEAFQGQPLVDPARLEASPVGKKLNPLLFDFEDGAAGIILLHGVDDSEQMEQFAAKHDGLFYMHLKTASTDLVQRSVDRVKIAMLACIVVIYIAMALVLRSFRRPLKIMVPTFAAAVTAAAILVHTGNPLSIFSLISLLLVVGLGLDYALFFNRLPDNKEEWNTTFRALWVCATTTILVFGILSYSQTPPLEQIGSTVALGAFLAIIFAAMWATRAEKSSIPRKD